MILKYVRIFKTPSLVTTEQYYNRNTGISFEKSKLIIFFQSPYCVIRNFVDRLVGEKWEGEGVERKDNSEKVDFILNELSFFTMVIEVTER